MSIEKKAIVCVTNDLATDQRVNRTCLALEKVGYEVNLRGRLLHNSLPLNCSYATHRVKHFFNRGFLFYSEYNIRLLFSLLAAKNNTLIYSNDLDTLPACYIASKIKNVELVYDTHELFTEVPELQKRPIVRKIWDSIEKCIFPKLKKIITVNDSLAKIYQDKYNKELVVVKNIPLHRSGDNVNTPDKPAIFSTLKDKKIILYQGALNVGRCVEEIIHSMELLKNNAVLLIIGTGDLDNTLRDLVDLKKLDDKVVFLGKVSGDEVVNYTKYADLGVCIMKNKGLNYYYSLPNRVFAFIDAGVQILASDFPEIRNVVGKYKTGELIKDGFTIKQLAEKIDMMLDNPLPKEQITKIAKIFTWEQEEQKLMDYLQS